MLAMVMIRGYVPEKMLKNPLSRLFGQPSIQCDLSMRPTFRSERQTNLRGAEHRHLFREPLFEGRAVRSCTG
jgi:hypothetical protein